MMSPLDIWNPSLGRVVPVAEKCEAQRGMAATAASSIMAAPSTDNKRGTAISVLRCEQQHSVNEQRRSRPPFATALRRTVLECHAWFVPCTWRQGILAVCRPLASLDTLNIVTIPCSRLSHNTRRHIGHCP